MASNIKKDAEWAEAKKKCRLNDETLKIAREMGLNPRSQIKNIDEGPHADEVTIGELGLYPGKTFLYLFNYGDEWEFKVEVEEIIPDKPLPLTPKIIGKQGEAPDQYGYGY